jgi:peptide deformylase
VSYLDENFERKEEILIGMEACIFQHENDHLDGILINED